LFLDSGADVERLDDGAETLGRGNRLQAGDSGSQDEDARGLDGAGRRHQHRHEPAVFIRGDKDGLVAGNVAL
jgi:hypothetical protein